MSAMKPKAPKGLSATRKSDKKTNPPKSKLDLGMNNRDRTAKKSAQASKKKNDSYNASMIKNTKNGLYNGKGTR